MRPVTAEPHLCTKAHVVGSDLTWAKNAICDTQCGTSYEASSERPPTCYGSACTHLLRMHWSCAAMEAHARWSSFERATREPCSYSGMSLPDTCLPWAASANQGRAGQGKGEGQARSKTRALYLETLKSETHPRAIRRGASACREQDCGCLNGLICCTHTAFSR